MNMFNIKRYIFLLFAIALILLVSCSKDQQYVLLISFDGFRWDYLNRGITPNLSEFAASGVKAESMRPSFPTKTFPNHYSIITGMEPENHGIILNNFKDLNTGDIYSMGDTASIRDPKWYKGEAVWSTLKRNDIRTASFFWPGSEVHDIAKRPDYFKIYQHHMPYGDRIDGVIEWLSLPEVQRPKFITLYFHETDSRGHESGPQSPEVNAGISLLDSLFGVMLAKINDLPIADQINIIIVSDHGMTAIYRDKVINISSLLPGIAFDTWSSGPMMMMDSNDDQVYKMLKDAEKNFRVYKKSEVPAHLHFSKNPFIWPLVLIAEPGYTLATDWNYDRILKYTSGGTHGYDNTVKDMHGIFIAGGPAFKKGMQARTLRNIDIYPVICKIFDVEAARNIDGKLEEIGFILD
jgi:predicted AlkP superfamily pyrophosphatase or phosphodiesterase